jgi:hypothetical protein
MVAITVTATASGGGSVNGTLLAVRVLNGASLTQGGATATTTTVTTPQLPITPGASGNWVYQAVLYGAASALTGLDANTTSISTVVDSTNGVTYAACRSTSATTTSSTTYGWGGPTTSSGNVYAASAEIQAAGTLSEDSSTPAVVSSTTAKTVTSASFTPPGTSVLVAVVVADWTGSSTVAVAVTDSASAYTWTQRSGISNDLTSVWVGIPKTSTISAGTLWTGTGTFGASWDLEVSTSLWTGTGTFTSSWAFGGSASWAGSGTFASVGTGAVGVGSAGWTGTGSLAPLGGATYEEGTGWSGTGSLATTEFFAAWTGTGTFGVSGLGLGFPAGLTGVGSFSVPQVLGGLVNGIGGAAAPQAVPGASQVAVAPPGSSTWQWIGTLGQVTALTYSFICPGGCDQLTMTVMVPAAYRTQLFNPGWQVKVCRGGHDVWHGKLDEPVPTSSGWNLTAVGTGNLGTNFIAFYAPGDVWPAGEPDEIISRAIARGLPWVNPGLNSSPYASQFWMGQATDPGSQTVTAFLTLICTRGGLTWYVNSQPGGIYGGDDLAVFPLPATPNRLLVATTPVARTLGGDINTIFVRYTVTADNATSGAVAAYSVVSVQNAASVAAHGVMETYIDLSDVGVMSVGAAQALASSVLSIYQRASFAGPFTVSYGQLLNSGGQPVDPGTDQAGTVCRLILTDFGYGGEIVPGPITFTVGQYTWDDFAQTATIVPYQSVDESLTGLLSLENTILTPVAAASS